MRLDPFYARAEQKKQKNTNKNSSSFVKNKTQRTPFVLQHIKLYFPFPNNFKSHQTNAHDPESAPGLHSRPPTLTHTVEQYRFTRPKQKSNRTTTERIQIETNEARIKTRTSKIISIKANKTRAPADVPIAAH